MRSCLYLFSCILVLSAASTFPTTSGEESPGRNWPRWRGEFGVSSETSLPTTWSPDSGIAWTVKPAGSGTSAPIVWGDQVIVTSQVGLATVKGGAHPFLARDDPSIVAQEDAMAIVDRRDEPHLVIESFDRSSGKRKWIYRSKAIGPFSEHHKKHNLATSTPVTDGKRVYALFGNGQVLCVDFDGQLVWSRHLSDYGTFVNRWGHGASPTLYDDLLILLVDHQPNAYLLALDAETGKERWHVDRGSDRISHATPVVIPGPDGDELVINSTERVEAFDPTTGQLLWHFGAYRQTPIPTPVFGDSTIYMTRGYRNSDFLAIRPGGRGDITESHILWRSPGGGSYVPSIVHFEGLLYMTNEIGVVTCADASDGKRVWRHRLGGIFFASPVAGDGKVYMVGETGRTFVLQAGRKPEIIAENTLEGRFVASPAISHGRIFLRSDTTLFAIGE